MKSSFAPAALLLVAALAASCNFPFLASGRPPAGPPSLAGKAPIDKREAENRRPRAAGCEGKDCPPPADSSAKPKPAVALQPRGAVPAGFGPRLARMLARDELEKLAAGHVQLEVPERMTTGNKTKVGVRLSDEVRGEFVKSLQDLGMSNADEIASASSFRAQLSGDGFKIDPPRDDEQAIGTGAAAWSWEVVPMKPGVQSLALTLAARVKVPGGGEEERDMPPILRKITVESGSAAPAPLVLQDRWLWIAGVLLLLVLATAAGVAVGRRQRR